MTPKRLVVVGSINADLTVHVDRLPSPGETLIGHDTSISPGGKGANQAVAAALLGSDVSFIGAVGDDAHSTTAMDILSSSGVELSGVIVSMESTGLAVITVDREGENTIIVEPGANARVNADYVQNHHDSIAEAEIVLLQGEIPASGFAAAARAATGRVVINLAPVIEVDQDALLTADPLVVNEHEAALVLNQLGRQDFDGNPHDSDPEETVARLLDSGFRSAVITLGARGCVVADGGEIKHVSSPTVTAVDTVGAGDAFTGALCHRLLEGDSLIDAARFAARVGAFAVTRSGAQTSYPSATDSLPS